MDTAPTFVSKAALSHVSVFCGTASIGCLLTKKCTCGTARHCTKSHGTARHGTARHGTAAPEAAGNMRHCRLTPMTGAQQARHGARAEVAR
jgi:hypothetical protein